MVWERLGDVASYNEPFAGSLAVLLGRPTEPRIETVNDLDCYLSNFWRALREAPERVAEWADYPVNEVDLHARHRWLVEQKDFRERMRRDPDYFDAKVAGWWVWGQCLWIGSGWCEATEPPAEHERPESMSNVAKGVNKAEWTGRANAGRYARGINAERVQFNRNGQGTVHQQRRPQLSNDQGIVTWQKRPKLRGRWDDGIATRRWQGGGAGGGSGVHAPRLTWHHQQAPDLSGSRGASGRGVHRLGLSEGLHGYLAALSQRLRRVRVCCGDWERVLTPSVTTYIGVTGILFDPPYKHELRSRCYAVDQDVSADVRAWCLAHGEDPKLRIALCGYEGEHEMPDTWECVPWRAHGGYSRSARGRANRDAERVWFSPHCLRPSDRLPLGGEHEESMEFCAC
jgi:hypothetical protein